MKRRDFIALLGSATAAWPLAARAQQPGKIPVVGIIWHHAGSEKEEELTFNYFRQAFADLGYVPGKNIIIEDRYAAEIPERFDDIATELVHLSVDVIFTNVLPSTMVAKRATSTIPIVFMVADPVRQGVVPSLSHPGGNATGVSYMAMELASKRLQIFKDAVPSLSRVALLVHAEIKSIAELDFAGYEAAANSYDITIETFKGRNKDELQAAFSKMAQSHFDGLIVGNYPFYYTYRREIAELALGASGLNVTVESGSGFPWGFRRASLGDAHRDRRRSNSR